MTVLCPGQVMGYRGMVGPSAIAMGWLVVEQDQALTARDTRESLVAGQRAYTAYLAQLGV
jgi:hypothetical protein